VSVNPYVAGVRGRCPNCGQGRGEGYLFDGFLKVAPACEACGYDFGKADSGDGPAVFIILIVGAIVVLCAVLTEIWYTPPYWVHALLWPPLILALSLGLLRPAKALMIALQFRHQASEGGMARFE